MIELESEIASFLSELESSHHRFGAALPAPSEVEVFCDQTLGTMFPQLKGACLSREAIGAALLSCSAKLSSFLSKLEELGERAELIAHEFVKSLPGVYSDLKLDAQAILEGDPAARSIDEVYAAYPGFRAIAIYRIAHLLYGFGVPVIPRMMTEYAHRITGIDIHPGARIGRSFVIDHGTGVVIGETTIIRNNVKIYQGVTLGAVSVQKDLANTQRHPTIEDNVVIYSNATILGGRTVIGSNSIIGGNVWLTNSVAPDSMVYHRSEVIMKKSGAKPSLDAKMSSSAGRTRVAVAS